MDNESKIEKATSEEALPAEILSQMSQRADEIMIDSQTKTDHSPYIEAKTTMSEGGLETQLLRGRSGADLRRTYDPENGETSYTLSVLYYSSGDRGAHYYSWSTFEPVMSYAINSEFDGQSEPVIKTDPSEISAVQLQLESYFPKIEQAEVKQSFARRILALLKK